MEPKNPYRKLAAFIPAIVFILPLIAYRGGAFNRFTKPAPEPVIAQPALVEGNWESATDPQIFMYSSKSAQPFSPTAPRPPAPTPVAPAAEKPPTYMGGSKSITIVGPPTGLAPVGSPPQPGPPPPVPNAPAP